MCDYPNREAAMVTIRTDEEGKPTVWCDPCLSQLVTALNDGGMPTMASCCGHGTHVGSVALADGRWIVVMNAEDWATFDSRRGTVADAEKNEAWEVFWRNPDMEEDDLRAAFDAVYEAARGARVSAENTTPTNHADGSTT